MPHDRDLAASRSARRPAIAPVSALCSSMAVTQVCLTLHHVILVARLSAATRLCARGYMPRIAILRTLLREAIEAAIEPEAIVSTNALAARLSRHFQKLRNQPDHPLAELAMALRQSRGPVSTASAAGREPTTLRLPTSEVVAIDNYRCAIRQAAGLCISRSALLRATIDAFARAFQI